MPQLYEIGGGARHGSLGRRPVFLGDARPRRALDKLFLEACAACRELPHDC